VDSTAVAIIDGAALAMVTVLVTMIWTIREMYIHEARFADAQLLVAAADAGIAKSGFERRLLLVQAMEWYRVSNEFMRVAASLSGAGALLVVTTLVLGGTAAAAALADLYAWWPYAAGGLACLATLVFAIAALAVYDTYGYLRFPPLQVLHRQASRACSSVLPFLATPWPDHWEEVKKIVAAVPELNDFSRTPFNTTPLAEEIIAALRRQRSNEYRDVEADAPDAALPEEKVYE